jgi:hypothetical protein
MKHPKTNRHYDFSIGLSLEFYEKHIENKINEIDKILIELGKLFRSINGAEEPHVKALEFANFLIKEGERLLPAIIEYYVDKFKSLSASIQIFVLANTPDKNNYFKDSTGSDKLATFANSLEYRTRSSSINWARRPSEQALDIFVSENLKNKISPKAFSSAVSLTDITERMCRGSNAISIEGIERSYYIGGKETIAASPHNNFRTITSTNTHVEAANLARQQIQINSYNKYHDCYRVKREYVFEANPYVKTHRVDLTTEYILDSNTDLVAEKSLEIYTTAGDKPLTPFVHDLHDIMPILRDKMDELAAGDIEIQKSLGCSDIEREIPPQIGSAGIRPNEHNDTAGISPIITYDHKLHKN